MKCGDCRPGNQQRVLVVGPPLGLATAAHGGLRVLGTGAGGGVRLVPEGVAGDLPARIRNADYRLQMADGRLLNAEC